jgi:transcriptional regulator NrdR family protein
MSKKRHATGGNIRCPYCDTTKPTIIHKKYNINTNSLLKIYRCKQCKKNFKTIETVETQTNKTNTKTKTITELITLKKLYKNNFKEFIIKFNEIEEPTNIKNFIAKIMKTIAQIDNTIFISFDLLPIDLEIQKFEDKHI